MDQAHRRDVDVSIVFRSLNEARWLGDALSACARQRTNGLCFETILVDSGSTDGTIEIAREHGARIITIPQSRFTFGRSLNWGCEAARGRVLVFISSHCIPAHDDWLANLVRPLTDGTVAYAYGRQLGHETTKFSETQLFEKYFPDRDALPQEGYFCNNANAAILRTTWEDHPFDEQCTGLEDMVLAKALTEEGLKIGYVADAPVYHIHDETMAQTYKRYYREALTLRDIMPGVHVGRRDSLRYFLAGVLNDAAVAVRRSRFAGEAAGIVAFRAMQFWGTYKGHNERRKLSREEREAYYYPKVGGARRGARTGARAERSRSPS